MSIVSLLVFLVIVGVVLYCVEVLIPMDIRIKRVIEAVVLVAVLIYVLQAFGLISGTGLRL